MATLENKLAKNTYKDLLKIATSTDNAGLTSSLQTIEDGNGTDSALQISTAGVKSTGTLEVSGNATFDTNTLFVDAANNRVGIGTTSAVWPLHISQSSNGGQVEIAIENSFSNTSGSTDEAIAIEGIFGGWTSSYIITGKEADFTSAANRLSYLGFWTRNQSMDSEKMRISSGGLVGIGRTPVTNKLEIEGEASKTSGGSWATNSDERIKTNIENANLNKCFEIIKNIPLKYYELKKEYYSDELIRDRHQLGWIAQDVEKLFPKAIQEGNFVYQKEIKDENGIIIQDELKLENIKQLQADQLIKVMYGAVQLLIQKVEALEAK